MSEEDPQVGDYVVQIFRIAGKPWLIGVLAGRLLVQEGSAFEVQAISMEEVSLN